MKTDVAIAGWVGINGLLELIKRIMEAVAPVLDPILTVCQIAVAIVTVIYVVWKTKALIKEYRRK